MALFGKGKRRQSRGKRRRRRARLDVALRGIRATGAQERGVAVTGLLQKQAIRASRFQEMIKARQLVGTKPEEIAREKLMGKLREERLGLSGQLEEQHAKRLQALGLQIGARKARTFGPTTIQELIKQFGA